MSHCSTLRATLVGALLGCLPVATHAQAQSDLNAETSLAAEVSLDRVLALVRSQSPRRKAAATRADALGAEARARGGLDDPEIVFQPWGVPLSAPYELRDADALMVGVRQALPPFGVRAARARAGSLERDAARTEIAVTERELVLEARIAYARYFEADREIALHREHLAIATDMLELVRTGYRGGQATQSDVLRMSTEQARLHADLVSLEEQREASRVQLNSLMARAPDAPLGPPKEFATQVPAPVPTAEGQPELEVARLMIEKSNVDIDAARAEAQWPAVMLGFDYMRMPHRDEVHNYGAMIGLSVPWFNSRHADEVEAAEARKKAEAETFEELKLTLAYELHTADVGLRAAQHSLEIIREHLLPQARQRFDATRAAFASGTADGRDLLESLQEFLEARIDEIRALTRAEVAAAKLERISGGGI